MVQHMLRDHPDDADHVHHRHAAVQVSGKAHSVPVRLLSDGEPGISDSRVRRSRRGRMRTGRLDQVQRFRSDAVHVSVPAVVLFRHGVLHLVGHTGVHVVPGRWSEMGKRSDSVVLAVLPFGCVVDTDRQVSGRVGHVGRGRRRFRRRVLRGQPERRQLENVRAGAAHRVLGAGRVVPVGRLRVAVPHPKRDQAASGPQQSGQTGETDDPDRRVQRVVHRAGLGGDRMSLLRGEIHAREDRPSGVSVRRRTRLGRHQAGVHDAHAEVLHDAGDGRHFRRVDMVGQDGRVVEATVAQVVRRRKRRPVGQGRTEPRVDKPRLQAAQTTAVHARAVRARQHPAVVAPSRPVVQSPPPHHQTGAP